VPDNAPSSASAPLSFFFYDSDPNLNPRLKSKTYISCHAHPTSLDPLQPKADTYPGYETDAHSAVFCGIRVRNGIQICVSQLDGIADGGLENGVTVAVEQGEGYKRAAVAQGVISGIRDRGFRRRGRRN
jgi:hypothetical protein